MTRKLILLGFTLAGLAAAPVAAQPPGRPLPPVDYANPGNWLCQPGRADACSVDQSAMRVDARGRTTFEEHRPARDPRVDCFYVYPTVSRDQGFYADLIPGPEERRVVASQFARFSAECRPFAPLYRQVTIQGLGQLPPNPGRPIDEAISRTRGGGGYDDVVAAWRHYLTNHNLGRGVVLIGHSQGAMHLERLIAEEIEGRPVQAQLVSAILLGANVQVPRGGAVGGTFKSVPLCRSDNQTGCVITYSSFRDTIPPGEGALFGQGYDGMMAGCTNPADLRRGAGQPTSYFDTGVALNWTGDWNAPVGTPFVNTPGLITTTCVSGPAGTYLQVHINPDPGLRIDDVPGETLTEGKPDPAWGLHRVDMSLSLGDLVELVDRQGRSWRPPR